MNEAGKPRILIVEDDPDLAKILGLQLTSEGFEVFEANNGAKAYAYLQEQTPDCIILDLMMPVMDGFAFLKRVRSLERTCNVPVLILTASDELRHLRKTEQYQADAYIHKPYNLENLTKMIRHLCGLAHPLAT